MAALALTAAAGHPAVAPLRARIEARVLSRLPPAVSCEDPIGRLAALVQGVPDACPEAVVSGPEVARLAAHVAQDRRRPMGTRGRALLALARSSWHRDELSRGLLSAAATAPGMRRVVLAALATTPAGVAWIEEARAVALHDLYEEGTLRLFAEGEPGMLRAAAGALRASRRHPARSGAPHVLRGLGLSREALASAVSRAHEGRAPTPLPDAWGPALRAHGCDEDCVPLLLAILEAEARATGEEPPPPGATLARHEGVLERLEPAEPDLAQHLRDEIGAVAASIARFTPEARPARLAAAFLHAQGAPAGPAEAPWEAGDLHAALARAAGTPGATALLLDEVAGSTGVPLTLWATPDGLGARVGDRTRLLAACRAARPSDGPDASWVAVPRGGAAALALGEAATRSLREGRGADAALQLEEARAAWAAAPGLLALDLAVRAWAGPAVTPGAEPPLVEGPHGVGRMGPGTIFVAMGPPEAPPPPRRRRGRAKAPPPPPPDLRADRRAAEEALAERLRAEAPTPGALADAAYWAARAGHTDLARLLLPAPGTGSADVRAAAALLAGEPVGVEGPLSAEVAGGAWEGPPPPCPPPWTAAPAPARPPASRSPAAGD